MIGLTLRLNAVEVRVESPRPGQAERAMDSVKGTLHYLVEKHTVCSDMIIWDAWDTGCFARIPYHLLTAEAVRLVACDAWSIQAALDHAEDEIHARVASLREKLGNCSVDEDYKA